MTSARMSFASSIRPEAARPMPRTANCAARDGVAGKEAKVRDLVEAAASDRHARCRAHRFRHLRDPSLVLLGDFARWDP